MIPVLTFAPQSEPPRHFQLLSRALVSIRHECDFPLAPNLRHITVQVRVVDVLQSGLSLEN